MESHVNDINTVLKTFCDADDFNSPCVGSDDDDHGDCQDIDEGEEDDERELHRKIMNLM
ncbi:GD11947 [Drosophila simulans]|uniref:GD11947 n=1 Tax=Drosophila simulans TaxID=7240 RepID=B4NTJ2_DROSI|nr:GD11947 [Drosophila simulans]